MGSSSSWPPALTVDGGPLYQQIVAALEAAAREGRLREGDRLPPQRTLAATLGVDLTTVTRAYAEARRRGLIDAVTGRGSFIAPRPEPAGPALDLSMNIPPAPRGVRLGELIARGVAEIAARTDMDALMSYHPGAGASADRAAAAAWLRPAFGDNLDPDRILIAAGAQSAMAAIAAHLAGPGGTIACEPLVYPGLLALAQALRLTCAPVAADGDGMRPDALDALCRARRPGLIYLNPTIANPTTVTMSAERRRALLEVAARHDAPILEDDPYAPLARDAPPPLAAGRSAARVWHVHTLSKSLTPGLRLAYVAAPSPDDRARLTPALRALSLMPAPLSAALLANWIRNGVAHDLLDGVRAEALQRQALARALLPGARAHPNGLHLWLPMPDGLDARRLAERALSQGLAVTPAGAFSPGETKVNAVRVALGAVPERARLEEALRRLAGLIETSPPR
ncbi:putative HTH-type transcriptional regulator [Methylopila jiangsuensis]|uniref:HTH-type transcriptional regulator n=1 Tax=Methylopila jiangsuensis TaxID=586230 RepID=A0A9W6JF74_9HYPH|nr:PLP-dependent aminotransferase family protein [Methylopila jiangsuensis]MDR6285563.1 DNA-binding transcriptional MocR family regulator [Methylopila jiangsuensis]GLK75321.1 putative HTH-type transcriptional regulator [Methylopila jiangsuensis]